MPPADENHRAPLLWLLSPYLAGMVVASGELGSASPLVILGATLLGAGAITASFSRWRRKDVAWAVLFGAAAALAGVVRMHRALDPGGASARWNGLPAREATLDLEVTRLFGTAPDEPRRLCVAAVVNAPEPVTDLIGQRVYFATNASPENSARILPSAHVQVRGILRRLEPTTVVRGSFNAYLLTSGVGFTLERAELLTVTREPSWRARFLQRTNERFDAILRHGLPARHPATGVYVAMFLGRKSELSDAQKENYLRSGTMHLFAISGLHIVVIAGCLHGVLGLMRVPSRVAAVAGLAVLWVFVEATGGTPSARRALLMVAFFWLGSGLLRPANPLAALVASALVVLLWDPLALLSASFQLSYAVVAALLLYGLPLRNRWHSWWNPWRDVPEADWTWAQRQIFQRGRALLALTAMSCSATLISTPLSIDYFQLGSPGAVLSNLVLVPVTSGAIAAGFVSLVCGVVGAMPLSVVFNHAGALILAVVDTGVSWAAAIPGMFFVGSFAAAWMAALIVLTLLVLLVAGYARGWTRFPGHWWTPPVVLIAMVVFLVTPGGARHESSAMKSAYELAMERLQKSDPQAGQKMSDEQRTRLAEIDRVYQGKIAERDIFLNQRLTEARAAGQPEEEQKVRQQIASERARLEEDREDEKNKVRKSGAES